MPLIAQVLVALDEDGIAARDEEPGRGVAREVPVERERFSRVLGARNGPTARLPPIRAPGSRKGPASFTRRRRPPLPIFSSGRRTVSLGRLLELPSAHPSRLRARPQFEGIQARDHEGQDRRCDERQQCPSRE